MSDQQTIEPANAESPPPDRVPEAAIQDLARYQEQLLRVIIHTDDRALRVLSLYITIVGAIVTAAFGLRQAGALNAYAIIAMSVAALLLTTGCAFAYAAVWSDRIYLPGRKSDFWLWALENHQDIREAAIAYARQAVDIVAQNERIANSSANYLSWAHLSGIAAPFIGAACALFAYAARNYIT